MTNAVPLTELVATIQEHYKDIVPYIIVADGTTHPRITHVEVQFDQHDQDDNDGGALILLRTRLGATACCTLLANRNVSLLFPGTSFSLIVDGIVEDEQGTDQDARVIAGGGTKTVTIRPVKAIRHQARSF